MIGIIVPAHDEEERIEDCVQSLLKAAAHPHLAGEAVEVIVVLDACSDRTGKLARSLGAKTIDVHAEDVGVARQTGAKIALATGARWLAFTNADSVVAPNWLAAQLMLKADAVCGTVAVEDWGAYGERMHRHFDSTCRDGHGHPKIQGANLGVSAAAYAAAGSFFGLEIGDDVALLEALKAHGTMIAWSTAPRVVTSVRPNHRASSDVEATSKAIKGLQQWAVPA